MKISSISYSSIKPNKNAKPLMFKCQWTRQVLKFISLEFEKMFANENKFVGF